MIYVVVPTYNEAETIERLIRELMSLSLELTVVVVDDNSPDGTGEIVEGLCERWGRVELLSSSRKSGLGQAYLKGFSHIANRDVDAVIKMDGDFSHNPNCIPKMVDLLDRYHLVIGSRFVNGGEFVAPVRRQVLSKGANFFASLLFGLGVKDATTGYHCFSREVLDTVLEKGIISRGFAFQTELIFLTRQGGLRVGEIPIKFTPREGGKSKMNWREILGGVRDLLRLRFR